MSTTRLTTEEVRHLVVTALVVHATHPRNAASVATALLAAEIDGQAGHGLSRVPSYAAQAASGKVDGRAVPSAEAVGPSSWRVDAGHGFAYPALDLAIERLAESVPGRAIGIASVGRSHHAGQAGFHVERLAERGLIGLFFGNSPKAIAPWGGNLPLFGTNPIAFAVPRRGHPPLVIDTSLSKVARGKIMLAARSGEPIPEGWALDATGAATTDPQAALAGSMLPMGEAKGAALVMMVEILSAALAGAHFGFEASSRWAAAISATAWRSCSMRCSRNPEPGCPARESPSAANRPPGTASGSRPRCMPSCRPSPPPRLTTAATHRADPRVAPGPRLGTLSSDRAESSRLKHRHADRESHHAHRHHGRRRGRRLPCRPPAASRRRRGRAGRAWRPPASVACRRPDPGHRIR
jgi:(2R)-3-sulfolactate dehydrogenase (NADP+)